MFSAKTMYSPVVLFDLSRVGGRPLLRSSIGGLGTGGPRAKDREETLTCKIILYGSYSQWEHLLR